MKKIISSKNIVIYLNEVKVNKIKTAAKEALDDYSLNLDIEFRKVISDTNAFSNLGFINQDIIDTGRLKDSQKVTTTPSLSGDKVTKVWEWDPVSPETGRHYAGDVFVGFYAFGKKWIPGRDWPNKAFENLDEDLFEKYLKKRIKNL